MRRFYRWNTTTRTFDELGVEKPKDVAAPYVQQDSMAPTWHPADGQMYESKSAFRAATKASGCVEVGNDKHTKEKPRERVDKVSNNTIERALREAKEMHGIY
jgi:hypothetical protein